MTLGEFRERVKDVPDNTDLRIHVQYGDKGYCVEVMEVNLMTDSTGEWYEEVSIDAYDIQDIGPEVDANSKTHT